MVIYATRGLASFNKQDGDSNEPIPKTNSVPTNIIYHLDSRKTMALPRRKRQLGIPADS